MTAANAHLDDLFSAAYDDALGATVRQSFDTHLESCPRCNAGFDQFRASIDAVRAVPEARMPVPVRLPDGLPGPAVGPLGRLWRRVGPTNGRSFGLGVATAAAAAGAAVLLGINVAVPKTVQQAALPNGSSGVSAPVGGTPGRVNNGVVAAPQVPTSVCPLTVAGRGDNTVPAGFTNRTTVSNPQRPHQELTIATASDRAAAGSTITVYARLSAPTTSIAPAHSSISAPPPTLFIPCLALRTAGEPVSAPSPAVATSAPSGLTEQQITIPAGLPPGTVLEIVGSVPAGQPSSADAGGLEATVRVSVS